jgi:hypothetical protein
LGFVGIKITPVAHACNPSKKDGEMVFEVARGLGVPVMVHTGSGIPFSDPMQAAERIEQFPDVKVVIAHGGSDLMVGSACYLARRYDNVFVEPSWLAVMNLEACTGSGSGQNNVFVRYARKPAVELCKYNIVFSDGKDREQVFCKT